MNTTGAKEEATKNVVTQLFDLCQLEKTSCSFSMNSSACAQTSYYLNKMAWKHSCSKYIPQLRAYNY